MASNLNSEFNYRYQVEGNTPWEKLKQLQNFMEGRKRAKALEEVSKLRTQAKYLELQHLKDSSALPHILLNIQADILETESCLDDLEHSFRLNRTEIEILQKLIDELYVILEPTRMTHPDGTPYSDDEMFEVNAANEFTVMIGREIHAEVIANGRPSPAKLRNAMSNPHTFYALQRAGLIPVEAIILDGNANPQSIEMVPSPSMIPLSFTKQQVQIPK